MPLLLIFVVAAPSYFHNGTADVSLSVMLSMMYPGARVCVCVQQLSEEQDGLVKAHGALSERLDKLAEEIAGVASDIMLLEATANTR